MTAQGDLPVTGQDLPVGEAAVAWLRAGLLSALVGLSGVFVGQWSSGWWSGQGAPRFPLLVWSLLPPVLVWTMAVVAAFGLAPTVLERRHQLRPVDQVLGRAAVERVALLSARAGLSIAPGVTWNPDAGRGGPRVYGRPGRYRIALSPAAVSAVARRPDRFDPVVLHELAHLRMRDVLPAFVAVYSCLALIPLAIVSLLTRPLSALTLDYLLRFAILVTATYLIGSQLARSREHAADLLAATWSHPDAVAATLTPPTTAGAATGPTSRRPTWLRWHPTPDERRAIVHDPRLLARPSRSQALAVSFTCGAALPLLTDLIDTVPSAPVLAGTRVAGAALFAALGDYLGSLLPAAARAHTLTRRALTSLAAAGIAGLAAGTYLSLGRTGLSTLTGPQVTETVLIGLYCTALLLIAAALTPRRPPAGEDDEGSDDSWGRSRRWPTAVTLAAAFALAHDLLLPAARIVTEGHARIVLDRLPTTMATAPASALGIGLATIALITAAASGHGTWQNLRPWLGWGVLLGLAGAVCAAWIRGHVGNLDDDAAWRMVLTAVWLMATAATLGPGLTILTRHPPSPHRLEPAARRLALGWPPATGTALLTGWAAYLLIQRALGHPLALGTVATLLRLSAGLTVAFGVPLLAAATLTAGFGRPSGRVLGTAHPRPRRGRADLTRAMSALAVLTAASIVAGAALPGVVQGHPRQTTSAVADYLDTDLPPILAHREAAWALAQECQYFPRVSTAVDLRTRALPVFDDTIAQARNVTGPADARRLNDLLLRLLTAERDFVAALADQADHPDPATASFVAAAQQRVLQAHTQWQAATTQERR